MAQLLKTKSSTSINLSPLNMEKVYILDGVSFLFRSYYAIRQMTNPKGESTNALYGFIRTIQKILKDFSPSHIVVVFDGPENKRSRTTLYKEYKSNRVGMPEDLVPQLEWAHQYCEYAGIPLLSIEGVEADDVMGTIAKWAERQEVTSFLCSSDKDLAQLVSEHIFLLLTHKENLLLDKEKVKETFGVYPHQMIDFLAIMGDASDNIPGVPGMGKKTAQLLLNEYDSLENILKNIQQLSEKKAKILKENKEQAFLSKQLATIHTDIPIPLEETFYQKKPPNVGNLQQLYQEHNFLSLTKELQIQEKPSLELQEQTTKSTYTLVDTEEALEALIQMLSAASEICIDTETSSLDPLQASLVGIGLSHETGKGWYLPCNGKLSQQIILQKLKPLLENPNIGYIGHNIKYDLHVLQKVGIHITHISFDTMLASYLISPQKNRHNLDDLSLEFFGKVKTPIHELIGKGKHQISMQDVPILQVKEYCIEDVDYTLRLKKVFEQKLQEQELIDIFQKVELPLIPVLARMEAHGIFIDQMHFKHMSCDLTQKIALLEKEIYGLAGKEFNIKSPKQLAEVLFDDLQITLPGQKRTTKAEILESLKQEYPIAKKLLDYRLLEKLRSTYVDALPSQINPNTHRIHCSFNQFVTATGRLASQNPNLQNIPIRSEEGRKIRIGFLPEKNEWQFLSADYSQIELRLLAHLSEDPILISAFQNDEDIHKVTAATVFGVPLEEVSKEMRFQAKAVNFGIIYGQRAYGLSQELGISVQEANAFIEKYFATYPKVRQFLHDCIAKTKETGLAKTMIGRKRPIPEIHSKNGMIRAQAERLAVNTPLQGSQADIIKMAMIQIDQKMQQSHLKGFMILQIHDELIFETPKEEIKPLQSLVKESMENVLSLRVPLKVNIEIGKNWNEC